MTIIIVKKHNALGINDNPQTSQITLHQQNDNVMTHPFLTAPLLSTPAAKGILGTAGGLALAFAKPLVAPTALCTVFTLIDLGTAIALSRRLRRAGKGASGKISSHRFGKTILTLVKIYGALTVAAMVQQWVICGYGSFDAVRFVAGLICAWQLLSILENESTCSDARWAKIARKVLVDKARRHLDLGE